MQRRDWIDWVEPRAWRGRDLGALAGGRAAPGGSGGCAGGPRGGLGSAGGGKGGNGEGISGGDGGAAIQILSVVKRRSESKLKLTLRSTMCSSRRVVLPSKSIPMVQLT